MNQFWKCSLVLLVVMAWFSLCIRLEVRRTRELIATVLVLEASEDGETGMRAVASVIKNRMHARKDGFRRTLLRLGQFSCLRYGEWGAIDQAKNDPMFSAAWPLAWKISGEVMDGTLKDTTNGALYFRAGQDPRGEIIGTQTFSKEFLTPRL